MIGTKINDPARSVDIKFLEFVKSWPYLGDKVIDKDAVTWTWNNRIVPFPISNGSNKDDRLVWELSQRGKEPKHQLNWAKEALLPGPFVNGSMCQHRFLEIDDHRAYQNFVLRTRFTEGFYNNKKINPEKLGRRKFRKRIYQGRLINPLYNFVINEKGWPCRYQWNNPNDVWNSPNFKYTDFVKESNN